jgi:hypothetical protein
MAASRNGTRASTRELNITVERIDAKRATEYLGTNWDNRRIRPQRVNVYANQMLRGQWLVTGDPIRFRADGHLVDGQHRLLAIVQAAVTDPSISIEILVIRDLPEDAFQVIDSGLQRMPGDALGYEQKNVNVKVAAMRVLIVLERGGDPRLSTNLRDVSRVDLAEYYADHQGEIDAALHTANKFVGQYGFGNTNFTAWLTFIVLAWRVNKGASTEFIDSVHSGENLLAGDARLVLRNFMAQPHPDKKSNRAFHLAIIIKAWNAWMNGETRQKTHLKESEQFPTLVKRRASIYARD